MEIRDLILVGLLAVVGVAAFFVSQGGALSIFRGIEFVQPPGRPGGDLSRGRRFRTTPV